MLTEHLETYRAKLGELADLIGYKLDAQHDDGRWSIVRLLAPDTSKPDILLDVISYGAGKGRVAASALLPRDQWGYAVKGSRESLPDATFDPSRDAKAIATQLRKLITSEAYTAALAEVGKRHVQHEQRVSLAVDLSMALKAEGLKFTEGHRNWDKPDHNGHVDMSFDVDGLGRIEVGYGSYNFTRFYTSASAWRIAKGLRTILS